MMHFPTPTTDANALPYKVVAVFLTTTGTMHAELLMATQYAYLADKCAAEWAQAEVGAAVVLGPDGSTHSLYADHVLSAPRGWERAETAV